MDGNSQELLIEVLPRFDLSVNQIKKIIEKPEQCNILSSHEQIKNNPYILSEEYLGDDHDDQISFSKIDRGIFPSPDIGDNLMDIKDDRRLRGILVDTLKSISSHSFLEIQTLLDIVNVKLALFPVWRKTDFNVNRVLRKKEKLESKVIILNRNEKNYIYLKEVFDLERIIEKTIRNLAYRSDLNMQTIINEEKWTQYLSRKDSSINIKDPELYASIIEDRIEQCKAIIYKPLSIISGEAGTGKTTIVKTIINAIKDIYGKTSFLLLAPTGKAAERLRKTVETDACTIHSFLSKKKWLNNLRLKTYSESALEKNKKVIIIDEASMIDTRLLGTLFKSIDFNCVERLIFVGDINQLPPIGIGKPFVEIKHWLEVNFPKNIIELKHNLRAIENEGFIQNLAGLFTNKHDNLDNIAVCKSEFTDMMPEEIFQKVQMGGDLGSDLRIVYWNGIENLHSLLEDELISMKLKEGNNLSFEKIKYSMFKDGNEKVNPDYFQIITPFRSEEHGVEATNLFYQRKFNQNSLKKGSLGGVTYFDKVIQTINRSGINEYGNVYSHSCGVTKLEVFNGETGFVYPHYKDNKYWKYPSFRLKKFKVKFKSKEDFDVNYLTQDEVNNNLDLAYTISVHKAQGSEFDNLFFILPGGNSSLLSRELFYTGITRARKHTTILIEKDIEPLLKLYRKESSYIKKINSSVMQNNSDDEIKNNNTYLKDGRIHKSIDHETFRSKSEVIIANILAESKINYSYEKPLYGSDGTLVLPDFTFLYNGTVRYWEHLGMLSEQKYKKRWEEKEKWYRKHGFYDRLIITDEINGFDSCKIKGILDNLL